MDENRVVALIVAAGSGSRMGGGIPKQYRKVAGVPVIARAFDALVSHPKVDAVHIVIGASQETMLADALGDRVMTSSPGGATRRESVRAGLEAIGSAGRVLIHDAARPFLPATVIDRLIAALDEAEGAIPALPVVDTLVRAEGGVLGDNVEREGLARVQTPQAFRFDDILAAHRNWSGDAEPTDDAQVARAAGHKVLAVPGDAMLEKLTHEADFAAAEARLGAVMTSRVGMGYDVHAFAEGDHVMLCGLKIPHTHALAGHSDADVGLHAITDALLGTIADGDIGSHFPPSDPRWKGADSGKFLQHAASLVTAKGGIIDHLDLTIICEAPKVGPHRQAMRERIAELLGLPIGRVSVKATTTEQLGFTGRREGMAAQAVASVRVPVE
ncbi:bifunctional 2-C-methyl-D-erythritol 4-phosphate cytidylyltransferase/2-C-methyl-D-erythritol 2,4-cyclodiphosphate synthase [Sphingomonas sp. CGMCC 1.13654]|uniref:Bifunctional enzyme IspD/IspF n=1 Tax=Sphingomonas chungangi TaxID=2683589 RepID=A0A838L8J2_9SPHN|nr:bifunctional 2-C-methyl-D-erythritol 4-phosphate cytidylyltransferase/2-C-methyl-D-erythritol 2,4-cyclodiphosphate synthase [Sphingomonas chungangi]MBA2935621.1 bifunctional 2-C-methyl-D-erythritol 4-phosphate cytidylyltransferase/2-C-methyl-D-erythritol 2,4-cyclodiphosphate synthase [Sphingomonas chungangi]MVW54312.1 bifunctional 2-C-methyl-D-erythritol 4-phosphate cytidylyltransferase/2-C-methyl-D-erythritol 2,4-cyclodiphosphate synthase [Sphingomonas chungangi]